MKTHYLLFTVALCGKDAKGLLVTREQSDTTCGHCLKHFKHSKRRKTTPVHLKKTEEKGR